MEFLSAKWVRDYSNDTTVILYSDAQKRVKRLKSDISPYFFILREDRSFLSAIPDDARSNIIDVYDNGEFVTFDGKAAIKIELKTPNYVSPVRDALEAKSVMTFESRVPYVKRWQIDGNHVQCDIKDKVYADLEVDSRFGFPDPKKAKYPIISFSMEDNKGEQFFYADKNEKNVIQEFIRVLMKKYHLLTGWNWNGFDDAYLTARMRKLKMRLPFIPIQKLDSMVAYQRFVKPAVKAARVGVGLDECGKRHLNIGKFEKFSAAKAWQSLNGDKSWLRKYNLMDVHINRLLDEKLRLLEPYLVSVKDFPLTITELEKMSYVWESLLMKEAQNRNPRLVIPSKGKSQKELKDVKLGGGNLLSTIPGYHSSSLVMDYKGLYPSMMQILGISPEYVYSWQKYLLSKESNLTEEEVSNLDIDLKYIRDYVEYVRREINKGRPQPMFRKVLLNLQSMRDDAKKRRNEFDESDPNYSYWNARQLFYKVLLVSSYGVSGLKSSKFFMPNFVNLLTTTTRSVISHSAEVFESLGWKVIYGHSVMPNTPVTIRRNGLIEIVPIEDLHHSKSDFETTAYLNNVDIWTENGWKKVLYSFRHSYRGRGYRILTDKGYVELTDEHSLVVNGKEIKPSELKVGDKIEEYRPNLNGEIPIPCDLAWFLGLYVANGTSKELHTIYGGVKQIRVDCRIDNQDLDVIEKVKRISHKYDFPIEIHTYEDGMNSFHCFLPRRIMHYMNHCHSSHSGEKVIPYFILNANKDAQKSFLEGYFAGDGRSIEDVVEFKSIDYSLLAGFNLILERLGIDYHLSSTLTEDNALRVRLREMKVVNRKYMSIVSIGPYEIDGYVYDIETENHHFCGGVGGILLHNTDSCIVTRKNDDYSPLKVINNAYVLASDLNEKMRNWLSEVINHDREYDRYLVIKPEDFAIDMVLSKAKTKRFMDVVWSEGQFVKYRKVTGAEYKRTDSFPLQAKVQMDIIDMCIAKKTTDLGDAAVDYLETLEDEIYSGLHDEELIISKNLSRNPEDYESDLPHVRAAKTLQKMGLLKVGEKINYVYVSKNKGLKVAPVIDGKIPHIFPSGYRHYVSLIRGLMDRWVSMDLYNQTDLEGWLFSS